MKVAAIFLISMSVFANGVLAAEVPNAAHALAQKFSDADAQKSQTSPPADYEADMLKRARAEQAAAQAAAKNAEAAAAPAAPQSPAAPARTMPSPPEQTATPPKVADTPEGAKKAEAKLEATQPAGPAPVTAPSGEKRASLLLAIEMGGSSKMAGLFQTLDPIICAAETCYISNGMEADAVRLSRAEAKKLKSTSEASQNSCRGMAGCVYRNVGLPAGAQIKLVELGDGFRVESHAMAADLDATCEISEDGLVCENPLATTDFRIWVVPEATAQKAGVDAIEEAVAAGLPQQDTERTTDK